MCNHLIDPDSDFHKYCDVHHPGTPQCMLFEIRLHHNYENKYPHLVFMIFNRPIKTDCHCKLSNKSKLVDKA